ncbi:DEAD/DEAH box helicase [Bifidobacterium castoris]|uniref:Phage protein n=1 Tax=Bifidobacterium castoris TaxID=2306972 RepID=A0A430FA77_9BIFI|nr:DEAD/DEAH box helicase [Bifidobacterium castoris]RSX49741.1 phage protein [Bifidobacterium castoris]
MRVALHDYQIECVRFALDALARHHGCGLFLDMGLGKTLTSICIMDVLHRTDPHVRFLVVAPKTVAVNTWPAELERYREMHTLGWALACGATPDPKRRRAALDAGATVTIINQENIGWLDRELREWPWDGIILDELSGYKDAGSKRFRILRRRRRDRTRGEHGRGRGVPTGWVMGLTGTPAAKGLMDLWAQVALLDDSATLGRSLTRYRDTYFTPGRRNGHVVYEWREKPDAFVRIMDAIRPFCMTMEAADRLPGLPGGVRVLDHWTDMPAATRRAYDRFRTERWIELAGTETTAANAGVLAGKMTQFAAGCLYPDDPADTGAAPVRLDHAKMDEVERIIAEAQGEPVLVMYQLTDELQRLRDRYGDRVHTPDEPNIVARWDAGDIPILAAHPAAAKYGLNLQHAGRTVIWMSLPWSLEDWLQSNARVARQGQGRPVLIHRIMEHDTIDERKLAVLEGRAELHSAVMDELTPRTRP